jgi:hypothetical protein
MWFSAVVMAFGALADNSSMLQNLLTPQQYSLAVLIIGMISAVLRFVTTQPLEDK